VEDGTGQANNRGRAAERCSGTAYTNPSSANNTRHRATANPTKRRMDVERDSSRRRGSPDSVSHSAALKDTPIGEAVSLSPFLAPCTGSPRRHVSVSLAEIEKAVDELSPKELTTGLWPVCFPHCFSHQGDDPQGRGVGG
jgi:hypothetical protein